MSKDLPNSPPSTLSLGKVPTGLPELFIVRGEGGYCWDHNSKKYIDYICGYGPVVLGHANLEVNLAVSDQISRGILFAANSPPLEALTDVLKHLFPKSPHSIFLKTGSEAVAAAIRLARAYTGKEKIIRCGFHGWHDSIVNPYLSWHQCTVDLNSPRPVLGVPKAGGEELFLNWLGDDLQKLSDIYKENRGCVAAMIIDPVQLREPIEENLNNILRLTHEEGALLILDEAKTGFRVSLTGVQGLYGIYADLTILSKAIANGFPLAAVIGSEEILSLASGAKLKGTYNTELSAIAAALKTIAILEQTSAPHYLNHLGQLLIDHLNALFDRFGLGDSVRAVPYRWPCMPFIWFHSPSRYIQDLKAKFYYQTANCGVLLLPKHMSYTCLAHTVQDIERTVQIVEDVLAGLITK